MKMIQTFPFGPQHGWHEGHHPFFRGGRGRREHTHGFGGRSAERGSVKYEILAVLWDGPRHGYEVMLAIEERRGFRPSPGSIYPTLQMLEDEGYVTGQEVDGKRVYTIAPKGSELLTKYRQSPEGAHAEDERPGFALMARGLRTMHGIRDAVRQIARSGDAATIEKAVEVLDRARRELYAILASEV